MSIAFVLGNGRSRLAVDLNSLSLHGKIYGCNALYRTFAPDVLVATDPEICKEIEDSGYPKNNIFYTRVPNIELGSRQIVDHYGYSSGPIALDLAIKDKHDKIFMLGFDLDSQDSRFNNVYAGTACYKPIGTEPTYWGNWERQIAKIGIKRPVQIVRVNDDRIFPKMWADMMRQVSVVDFIAAINNCKLEAL